MRKRKSLTQRNNRKKVYLVIILLLSIGLGYAYLTSNLTIQGTSKIATPDWNVYFDNVQVSEDSIFLSDGDSAPVIDTTTKTNINYTVTLKPGGVYEFLVDVKNDGALDAMIGTIINKMDGVDITTLPAYIDYSVSYYDNQPLEQNQILKAGEMETYKVRIAYRRDILPEEMPNSLQTKSFTFGVTYRQADNTARVIQHSFQTDPWDRIIANVQSGNIPTYYTVGSIKEVELGNNLGTQTLRIVNTTTPEECETPGFSQTACGFVLEFKDVVTTHTMKDGKYNTGGWPVTEMRRYLNSTTDQESFYNSLPPIIRNAIIDTTVISGHGSTPGETNFTSTDKIYLFSPYEIWKSTGSTDYPLEKYDSVFSGEYTRQLDYYKATKTTDDSHAAAAKYMGETMKPYALRTANLTNFKNFISVSNTLGGGGLSSSESSNIAPAFRIG